MRRFASLRRTSDFSRLRQRGRRTACGVVTLYRAESRPGEPRSIVGITVGKPVGKAAERNRVKRRIAAILHEALEGRSIRLLVVARPGAAQAPFARLRSDLERALG